MSQLRTSSLDRANPALLWKANYWRKKGEKLHEPEDFRLCELAYTQVGVRVMVNKLLECDRRLLDPPDEFRYAKLQSLLLNANVQALAPSSTDMKKTILLDERKDPNSIPGATRDWDVDGRHGYFRYPPNGIESSNFFQRISSREFVQRLNGNTVSR
jgi:hypothetical protein